MTRLCECHGEPMYLKGDGRSVCMIKRRESWRRANQKRLQDPHYRLLKQLWDSSRVRVR